MRRLMTMVGVGLVLAAAPAPEAWTEDGTLKVRGYLGFFYRTQTWQKAK